MVLSSLLTKWSTAHCTLHTAGGTRFRAKIQGRGLDGGEEETGWGAAAAVAAAGATAAAKAVAAEKAIEKAEAVAKAVAAARAVAAAAARAEAATKAVGEAIA